MNIYIPTTPQTSAIGKFNELSSKDNLSKEDSMVATEWELIIFNLQDNMHSRILKCFLTGVKKILSVCHKIMTRYLVNDGMF